MGSAKLPAAEASKKEVVSREVTKGIREPPLN